MTIVPCEYHPYRDFWLTFFEIMTKKIRSLLPKICVDQDESRILFPFPVNQHLKQHTVLWQFPINRITRYKKALSRIPESEARGECGEELLWKSPHHHQMRSHCLAVWVSHELSRNQGWTDGRGGSVLSLGVRWARDQQESCDDGTRWVAGLQLANIDPAHRRRDTV